MVFKQWWLTHACVCVTGTTVVCFSFFKFFTSRTFCIKLTFTDFQTTEKQTTLPVGAACPDLLAQPLNLSPHSRRSSIRDGGKVRIPSPATWNVYSLTPAAQVRLELKSYTIPSTSSAQLQWHTAGVRCDHLGSKQRGALAVTPAQERDAFKLPLLLETGNLLFNSWMKYPT